MTNLNTLNSASSDFFSGADHPVNPEEVHIILDKWQKHLDHRGSENFYYHVEFITGYINNFLLGRPNRKSGEEHPFVPFEFGLDTVTAFMAYIKAYAGTVSIQRQHGMIAVISNERLLERLMWLNNHRLEFQAGIELLESKRDIDLFEDSFFVFCSEEMYQSLDSAEHQQLSKLNNAIGHRTLMITDHYSKGFSLTPID